MLNKIPRRCEHRSSGDQMDSDADQMKNAYSRSFSDDSCSSSIFFFFLYFFKIKKREGGGERKRETERERGGLNLFFCCCTHTHTDTIMLFILECFITHRHNTHIRIHAQDFPSQHNIFFL